MSKIMRRQLGEMPFDKVFFTEKGEELCRATGYEICDGDPENLADWWNEYQDADGNYHYGR